MNHPMTHPVSSCRRWSSAAPVRTRRPLPAGTQSTRTSRSHPGVT